MVKLLIGDCRDLLKTLPSGSVHCCVTSPPYFGLRDYGVVGQIGLEQTPDEYVAEMVAVFREVRRVLRDDGTLWLNLGDSYSKESATTGGYSDKSTLGGFSGEHTKGRAMNRAESRRKIVTGLKPKDLIGIPWSVATALRDPYYTGRITRERDRAWIAAMIDGEGSICGFHHIRADDGSPRAGVHVTITNSNIPILDEAHRIWPTSRSEHQRAGAGHLGKRTTYRWIVHGAENKIQFLREVYPYLIAKKRQAVVAYNLLLLMPDAKKVGHSAARDASREQRKFLTDLLSALNQGGAVDIPSWLVEPPTMFEPGWYLRQDIIWHKPNPMPEGVRDRCTKSHEYIFLLSKSQRYYYDADAIKEKSTTEPHAPRNIKLDDSRNDAGSMQKVWGQDGNRNKRSVWTVNTRPYKGAHFATFPPDLIAPCILAGCPQQCCAACGAPHKRLTSRGVDVKHVAPSEIDRFGTGQAGVHRKVGQAYQNWLNENPIRTVGWQPSCDCDAGAVGGTVLDPFGGSGTTGAVASANGRSAILIELNSKYTELVNDRCGLFLSKD